MSEELENVEVVEDELTKLKEKAALLGVTYHPSIGVEKLREKINAALADEPEEQEEETQAKEKNTKANKKAEETIQEKNKRIRDEALKLVRIRLTCMNPTKKEWFGEVFTVGNSVIGTVRKFVPFNAEEGWHVPNIMYEFLRDRQCQIFVSRKLPNGMSVREGKLIKEFAIEVLPNLTEEELKELARRQAMSQSVEG